VLHILFYLDRLPPGLEPSFIGPDSFQLGCVPVVNLYRKRAEPLRLTQTEAEVRVIPDVRRPLGHEIYSIDRVTASSPAGETMEYLPFYELKPPRRASEQQSYYYAARRTPPPSEVHRDSGTEVYLSLVDSELVPSASASETLHVETTCLNRDLPSRLPFGVGRPRLQLAVAAPVAQVVCLTPPTPTLRPNLGRGSLWPLISHLTLNHLSISDAEDGAEALRAILRLYDFADSIDTRKMIDGLVAVTSQRVVGRAEIAGRSGIVRGIEVTIEFDEEQFAGHGLFILASVLERFLGLYCSINSFTTLVATTRQRDGELKRWPPRAGEANLL
jgi:type VI secretion system protein ImpG